MAGRLSFSIAVNLLTQNFKKGADQVKASFRAIKAETVAFAAALGAGGVGLTELVGRFAQVARETSRVNTALKNVSGSTAQYADNLQFVTRMANQYGIEMNSLTGNYARFAATANISGMSLIDQRKIFESLSRACTAFGLSADGTNRVFTALSQMMSKGKVSSEELRQQMGEQLPVALQAMAKAAGVSMGEMEKLMQQGQLMSADVLPKFADALNELVPNVSTDNLEASIGRLQNTFTELVNSTGVQGFYKRTVELLDSLLQRIRDGVTGIVAFVATMIGLKMVANIAGYFQRINGIIAGTTAAHQRAEQQKLAATDARIKAEQRLAIAQAAYNNANAQNQLAAYNQLEKAKTALARAQAAERRAIDAAAAASAAASAANATTVWGRAANRIKLALAGVATAAKGALASMGMGVVIAGISAAVGALANMVTEWKRIRQAYDDYQSRMDEAANDNTEVVKLQNLLKVMNNRRSSQEEINAAQSTLQGMLGDEKLTQDEINKRVQQRIALLKEAARAEQAATEIAQTEGRNRDLARGLNLSGKELENLFNLYSASRSGDSNARREYAATTQQMAGAVSRTGIGQSQHLARINQVMEEYLQNQRILNDATEVLSQSQTAAAKIQAENNETKNGLQGDGGTGVQSELEKQQARYAQSLRELNARKEVEGMTTEAYNQALDELNRASLIAAKATGDREVLESRYVQALQGAVDGSMYNPATAELASVQAEFAEAERKAKAQLDARLITEEQYKEALRQAATSAALAAASINGIGGAAEDFIQRMQGVVAANTAPIEMPTLGTRDTTFDYKKSDAEIGQETLDVWINYRDDLQEKLAEAQRQGSDIADQLQAELNTAMANVTSLEDALKLARVQEDVENLRNELGKGIYSGVKDIASSSDRIVSAFQNVANVMNDADASGWEKIMAIWNAMTQTVDGFLSIINAIQTITELTERLGKAKQAEALIDSTTTATKITNKQTEAAVSVSTGATERAVAQQEVAANTAKGTSAAAASAAKLPFPANLIAIASAIAAAVALFASIPKFATGGVVTGGPKSGDKLLARVNAGEMILNPGQQSNLFRMLNGEGGVAKAGETRVNIGFDRVRGSDIYLALKNYMKSTGKTL